MANDWREIVEAVIALQSDDMKTDPGPSLQWYPQQWLGDPAVQLMGMLARGCHHHLLMVAWKGFALDEDPIPCSLPDDGALLRSLCQTPAGWGDIFEEIRRGWKAHNGRLWNLGLCRSYLHQMTNRRGAKKAADARWGNAHTGRNANASKIDANASKGLAEAEDPQCTSASPPTPTPTPQEKSQGVSSLAALGDKILALIGKAQLGADDMRLLTEGVDAGGVPDELVWAAQMVTHKKLEAMRKPVSYLCTGPWEAMAGFERFCAEWPAEYFSAKPEAAKAWWATRSDRPQPMLLLDALDRHKKSGGWADGFVPGSEKWIRGHCWNDPPPKSRRKSDAPKGKQYRSLV